MCGHHSAQNHARLSFPSVTLTSPKHDIARLPPLLRRSTEVRSRIFGHVGLTWVSKSISCDQKNTNNPWMWSNLALFGPSYEAQWHSRPACSHRFTQKHANLTFFDVKLRPPKHDFARLPPLILSRTAARLASQSRISGRMATGSGSYSKTKGKMAENSVSCSRICFHTAVPWPECLRIVRTIFHSSRAGRAGGTVPAEPSRAEPSRAEVPEPS